MKLNIRIDYDNPALHISDVAVILNSFALIHTGMHFMLNGNVEQLGNALSSEENVWRDFGFLPPVLFPFPGSPFGGGLEPGFLYDLGRGMFEFDQEDDFLRTIPTAFLDLPVQTLVRSVPSESVPELASVKKGSLEAEIEKIIERLRKLFGGLISSPSILSSTPPEKDGKTLNEFLDELGTESPNQPARYVGAGIVTIGAGMLAIGYRELKVTRVETSSPDDDEIELMAANEDVNRY